MRYVSNEPQTAELLLKLSSFYLSVCVCMCAHARTFELHSIECCSPESEGKTEVLKNGYDT